MGDIYKTKLPTAQKEFLIKSMQSTMPYQEAQQMRLQNESIRKQYDSRIKEIASQIEKALPKDRPELQRQQKLLQDKRDELLGFQSVLDQEAEKEVYDNKNPLHLKRSEQLLKDASGDVEKANEMLGKEFK